MIKTLWENEAKARRLIDSNIIGVNFADLRGHIIEANDAFLQMVGYTRKDLLAGRVRWDLMTPPEYDQLNDRAIEELRHFGVCMPYEKEYIRKDGSRVPILLGSALLEESGDLCIGFVLDITGHKRVEDDLCQARDELDRLVQARTAELSQANAILKEQIGRRKQVEEAMRRSEEQYRLLFESNPQPMWVYDLETLRFLAVNDSAVRHYGYTLEEFLSMTVKDIRPQEDVPALIDEIDNHRSKSSGLDHSGEWRHRNRDGTIIDVEITSHGLNFANRRAELVLAEDITERKRMERALRQSEERFRTLIENASDMITILDAGGTILYESPSIERVLGYRPEERVGKHAFELIHPGDLSKAKGIFEQGLRNPNTVHSIECRLRHKDGTWRVLEITGNNLLNKPVVAGIVVNSRDITERKQAEQAKVRLRRRLVTAQEEERRRIARELHDQTGQQLAALMLGLQALRAAPTRQSPDQARLQQLQELTGRLGREVHQLALELRPAALDDLGLHTALWTYLEGWSERCKIPVAFHSVGFEEQRLEPEVETAIYRIVQEAMTNVLKHADARSVSIIVERRHDHLLTIVEDNGKGFDAERVMRAPEAERRLGLLGMQERVALVGGSLSIESGPEVGTSVFVRIPVQG